MTDAFSRTELLIGAEGLAKLEASTVAVLGLGGVGSYAAEALARSGLGGLVLVDEDEVCVTNINRQILATRSTIGEPKAEVMRARVLDINPRIRVEALRLFYGPDSSEAVLRPGLSYVVDAIDTVSSKLELIVRAKALGIPIVSSMGAGNKLDPTLVEVADISETSMCPLARVMRKELRKRGIESLTVVYSREPPIGARAAAAEAGDSGPRRASRPGRDGRVARRSIPGSIAFVPAVFGLVAASVVVREIVGESSRVAP
jgi:tRNA threonylcarbamoyladenosine dehydratase